MRLFKVGAISTFMQESDGSIVKLVKNEVVRVPKSLVGHVVRITPLEITPRSFLESLLGKQITDRLMPNQEDSSNERQL